MSSTSPSSTPSPSIARRRAAAVLLVASGVASMLMGALEPVGSDGTSAQLVQATLAHPVQTTIASVFDLLGVVLAVPGVAAVWGYLRGRGRVLGAIAVPLVGAQAAAISFGVGGQQVALRVAQIDPRVAVTLNDTLGRLPLFSVFVLFIYLGLIAQILLSIAAVRGGLVRWWVPALLVLGLVINVVLDNDLYGLPAAALFVLPLAADLLVAVGLFRAGTTVSPMTRPVRHAARVADPVTA